MRLGGLTLPGGTVELAAARLAGLPARFSPGDAARALGTSRRVAIPLLERLDARAVTVRHPDGTRTLRSSREPESPPPRPTDQSAGPSRAQVLHGRTTPARPT